jgi:hypothetical protein
MAQSIRPGIEKLMATPVFQATGAKKVSTAGDMPIGEYTKPQILNLRDLQQYFEGELRKKDPSVTVGIDELTHGHHYRLVTIGKDHRRDPFIDVRYGG